MRIFHLITSLGGGGTELFLQQLLTHAPNDVQQQVGYIKDDGVMGMRLRKMGLSVRPVATIGALWRALRQEKPDVLHTLLYRAHQVGRVMGRAAKVPTIVSSQRSTDAWLKGWPLWLEEKTLPLCHGVLVNSHAAETIVRRRLRGKTGLSLGYLPNSVDPARVRHEDGVAARRKWAIPDDVQVAGTLMRLHSEKGADLLPAFVQSVLQNNRRRHLIIGGVGPLERELRQSIGTQTWSSRVHWAGWIDDVAPFYSAIDAFWLLSREESMPQCLLEASAAGIPWVAPAVGDVVEFANSGPRATVFDRPDAALAAAALIDLFDDIDRARQQAQSAAPSILARSSTSAMADTFYRWVRQLPNR